MSVVKSYGLEKDNNQTVTKAVDSSCEKAVALTVSVTPWIAVRQLAAHGFGAVIAVCALYFYGSGQLSLVKCILVLIASFMLMSSLKMRKYVRQPADARRIHAYDGQYQ